MQWSDVTTAPTQRILRQFAGLLALLLVGLAFWRTWRSGPDAWVWLLAGFGLAAGVVGLVAPRAMRFVYTGWMVVAFPIGWTVSRLVLAGLFYLVFTPVALVFRLVGRDALQLRRPTAASTWNPKVGPTGAQEYFRQF